MFSFLDAALSLSPARALIVACWSVNGEQHKQRGIFFFFTIPNPSVIDSSVMKLPPHRHTPARDSEKRKKNGDDTTNWQAAKCKSNQSARKITPKLEPTVGCVCACNKFNLKSHIICFCAGRESMDPIESGRPYELPSGGIGKAPPPLNARN